VLHELAPGVMAWQTKDVGAFRAFALHQHDEVVLVDPLPTDEAEKGQIRALGRVLAILLTAPWHARAAETAARTWGAPVYAHPEALAGLSPKIGAQAFPAYLPFDLEAIHMPAAQPGLCMIYDARDDGTLLPGDAWQNEAYARFNAAQRFYVRYIVGLRDGLHPLSPRKTRDPEALRRALELMMAERPVKRLLVSHGACLIDGAEGRMKARLSKGP
jgi:glyoxylase-like metal-dependent hydrolase (beta-lactamase superfamily II)